MLTTSLLLDLSEPNFELLVGLPELFISSVEVSPFRTERVLVVLKIVEFLKLFYYIPITKNQRLFQQKLIL